MIISANKTTRSIYVSRNVCFFYSIPHLYFHFWWKRCTSFRILSQKLVAVAQSIYQQLKNTNAFYLFFFFWNNQYQVFNRIVIYKLSFLTMQRIFLMQVMWTKKNNKLSITFVLIFQKNASIHAIVNLFFVIYFYITVILHSFFRNFNAIQHILHWLYRFITHIFLL